MNAPEVMRVRAQLADEAPWFGTWEEFVKINEAMGDELGDVLAAVLSREVYTGGGGAAPTFTVRRADSVTLAISRQAHDWLLGMQAELLRRAFAESTSRWFLAGVSFRGIDPALADALCVALPSTLKNHVQRTISNA